MKKSIRRALKTPRSHLTAFGMVGAIALVAVLGIQSYRLWNESLQFANRTANVKIKGAMPNNVDGILPLTQVKEIAERTGSDQIAELTLVPTDSGLVYKVRFINGSVSFFNAISGESTTAYDNDSDDEQPSVTLPSKFASVISPEDARRIAQAQFPSSKIARIVLDSDGSTMIISARFTNKARIDIDATTGRIIRTKSPNTPASSTPESEVPEKNNTPSDTPPSNKAPLSSPDTPSNPTSDPPVTSHPDTLIPESLEPTAKADKDNGATRIEGILTESNGSYAIVQNGTAYLLETNHDKAMAGMVGKTVKADGELLFGNILKLHHIEPK